MLHVVCMCVLVHVYMHINVVGSAACLRVSSSTKTHAK